ncbi:hypothetical protein [Brachybacterium sp. AOP29-B2-41]|uniref:hypothetical protein n=1 Tax=Brachybacterium sp. AOP29-B2-41 TaxID=3457704 RepID=UPI00262BDE88|nr:hypothetical protein [uncultured Brachybacterium sp.]
MVDRDDGEDVRDVFSGESWQELIDSVGLARPVLQQPPVVRRRTRASGLAVAIFDFVLPRAEVWTWVQASFGDGAKIPRAWVTFDAAKDVLGIGDLPTDWRLGITKEAGSPRERYIMVDDGDPARVTVGVSATYAPLGGQRS